MFSPVKLAQNAEAAKDVASVIGLDGCIMELKLDGFRLLAHVTENGVETYTRTGKRQTGKLPHIERELAQLPAGTWLDGEIVAIQMRPDGGVEHNWGAVQTVMGSNLDRAARLSHVLTFSVFDVLSYNGTDSRPLPFLQRRKFLEAVMSRGSWEAVVLTPQMQPSDDALAAILALGFEGAIVKRLSSPYASGKRGSGWWKLKGTFTEDVVIVALPKDGQGKYDGQVGAVVFGQYENGVLAEKGRCSGMTDAQRLDLSRNPEAWLGRVIEVQHMGVMPTGGWRHPVWHRVREDKLASDCVTA